MTKIKQFIARRLMLAALILDVKVAAREISKTKGWSWEPSFYTLSEIQRRQQFL